MGVAPGVMCRQTLVVLVCVGLSALRPVSCLSVALARFRGSALVCHSCDAITLSLSVASLVSPRTFS